MAIVMGTAGHIDHGKTSLVRALTGIDCDRLEEEKRRGITIELGFAWYDLPGGERMGIVDVPGHERFVRNMVAGASGIDFVLLVIAADEGVMPQTREHVEICSLLGIKHGMVALTKVDMVDESLLELAQEDVSAFLQGSFLEQAPVFPVSSSTGEGLEALRQAIGELGARFATQRRTDLLRLPVDRIFTLKGHGTVITGTMISGSAVLGDAVEVYPRGLVSKIRGLQSHGHDVEQAEAGRRTSINLQGLEVADIERGDVVAHPGTLFPSPRWVINLTCLSSSPRPLRHRGEVHFHHGAKEVAARLYFYGGRERLMPGETALAEVRFREPLVGVLGDRCVIRAFSPLRTVGGGEVLIPLDTAPKRRHMGEDIQKQVQALPQMAPAERILNQLELAGEYGCSQAALSVLTNLETKLLDKLLLDLSGRGLALMYDKDEKLWLTINKATCLEEACLTQAREFHNREPLKAGMPKGVLLSGWGRKLPPKLAHCLINRLLKAGHLETEGELIRLREHTVSLAADEDALRATLMDIYNRAGMAPPNFKDVLEEIQTNKKAAQPVFNLLISQKELYKINEDLYFSAPAIEELKERIIQWFNEHEDLTPGGFKELSGGLSRKYIIPLLEYFDKERFTIRIGDTRQLRGQGR